MHGRHQLNSSFVVTFEFAAFVHLNLTESFMLAETVASVGPIRLSLKAFENVIEYHFKSSLLLFRY